MNKFEKYAHEKNVMLQKLEVLKELVEELGTIGFDPSGAHEKIKSAEVSIKDEVLTIAIIGAFSDGKTTVLAGWLGEVMENMKIDTDESSDDILKYKPVGLKEKCIIYDTPGLFGDKVKEDRNSDSLIKYSDITKQYLSEAHVVLYVVDATNPLKDSHKDVIRWLFQDLNKLSSTIFVINKMDEVSDLRDPEDFSNQEAIKKNNLIQKIVRYTNPSKEEVHNLKVVCVAANPNGRGLEFWFERVNMYKERSRIDTIEQEVNNIIEVNTREKIIEKTGMDVIKNMVLENLKIAEEAYSVMNIQKEELQISFKRTKEDLKDTKAEIRTKRHDTIGKLQNMENSLMNKLRTLEANEITDFLEDEIGFNQYNLEDTGYKLQMNISIVMEDFAEEVAGLMDNISHGIEKHLIETEKFIDAISDKLLMGTGLMLKSVAKVNVGAIKKGVFAARDMLGKVTGKVIKFKPWQASKIASNISKAAGPLAVGVQVLSDLWEMKKKKEAEQNLQKLKLDIGSLIKAHFKEVYDILSSDENTIQHCAPSLRIVSEVLEEQEKMLQGIDDRIRIIEKVDKELKNI